MRLAQLPVMYVFLYNWEELRRTAERDNLPWPMPASQVELPADIVRLAASNGINLRHVPSPIPF